MEQLNAKLNKIIEEHEILKKQVKQLTEDNAKLKIDIADNEKKVKQLTEDNAKLKNDIADNEKKVETQKKTTASAQEDTQLNLPEIKELVKCYSEEGDWEKLRKGLLELLPKKSKAYLQAQKTSGYYYDLTVERHLGECGHTELVTLLLDAGMSANKTVDILLGAAATDRHELVQILIDSGCDVNVRSGSNGETPLHTATRDNQLKLVKILLQAGADVDATNYNGKTCLHLAVVNVNSLDIVKCLVEAGANTARREKYGYTALTLVSGSNEEELREILSLRPH